MIHVFVGDTDCSVAIVAQKFDERALLIDENNIKNVISTHNIPENATYYSSLGDLSATNFIKLLNIAHEIHMVYPQSWSDGNNKSTIEIIYDEEIKRGTIKDELLIILSVFSTRKPIHNFIPFVPKMDFSIYSPTISRQEEENEVWVAGCSISEGVGVSLKDTYAYLVSSSLNMKYNNIAKRGSSNAFQSSQICNSEIKQGDIVIWGITSTGRYPYFNGKEIEHLNVAKQLSIKKPKYITTEMFLSSHMLYVTLNSIKQVIKYCNLVGAKLYLIGLLTDVVISTHIKQMHKNFISLYHAHLHNNTTKNAHQFYDTGDDGIHPGTLTHKWYASEIMKLMDK